MTGVLSLTGFKKRAMELLSENPNTPYFLSFNNIRDFKFINDSLGREAVDDLLKFWVEKSISNLKKGANEIQGYYFYKPMTVEDFEKTISVSDEQ